MIFNLGCNGLARCQIPILFVKRVKGGEKVMTVLFIRKSVENYQEYIMNTNGIPVIRMVND